MNIEDICFFDTETRAEPHVSDMDANVKTAGSGRYARSSFVIISTWAIGNQPVFDVSLDEGFDGDWLSWDRMPDALKRFHDRVEAGKAWYAAWNMGFDRSAWNFGTPDWPLLRPEHTLDIMVQAVASNLPPSLEGASRYVGRHGKQEDGKDLINLFTTKDGATPQSHPAEWGRFKSYGRQDTDELREVFRSTRALPLEEWQEYWAAERINERGMSVDVEFCRKAAAVAVADAARMSELLHRYTNGQIRTVNQHQKLGEWVWDQLEYSEAREILVKNIEEEPGETEDDETLQVATLSLERARVERLLAFFDAMRERDGELSARDEVIYKVLDLRQFGASSAPKKFKKVLDQHVDGKLTNQYVFNGAAQTGRFSAKGVQVHNMTRSTLGKDEAEAIEMINDLEV